MYVGIANSGAAAEAVAFLKSYSVDFSSDKVDVTAFGDANKTYVAGLPDCSGSYNGYFDDATAQLYTAASDGQPRRFYLYAKTPSTAGPYWFGTALWDFSVEGAVDGATSISGSFAAASAVAKIG